jgi:hypothetical protein
VGPETVVTSGNSKPGAEIVQNCPKSSGESQGSPDGSNAADEWNASDEIDIEPIDMLVPIIPGNWSIRDMRLLASFEFWAGRSWLDSRVNTSRAHGESLEFGIEVGDE